MVPGGSNCTLLHQTTLLLHRADDIYCTKAVQISPNCIILHFYFIAGEIAFAGLYVYHLDRTINRKDAKTRRNDEVYRFKELRIML